MKTVAHGAAVHVDAGAGREVRGVRLHMGADYFTLDSRVERNVDELALMRERRVIDGDGNLAIHEVHKYGEGNQNKSDDESNDEPHACLFSPPEKFIVEHGRALAAKTVGVRPKEVSPSKLCFGFGLR
jgi:hypothetical protein